MARRLVGMDLGVATAHTVVVLNEEGRVVARRRCRGERHSLEALERAALKDAPEGTRLEVVFEATGAAWLPVAVFFVRRGSSPGSGQRAEDPDPRARPSAHADAG